jgi:hypothetical protein
MLIMKRMPGARKIGAGVAFYFEGISMSDILKT